MLHDNGSAYHARAFDTYAEMPPKDELWLSLCPHPIKTAPSKMLERVLVHIRVGAFFGEGREVGTPPRR
jgi:hypothetical protein